jgi:alpha-galactosidase
MWSGTPGIEGHLADGSAYPRLSLENYDVTGPDSALDVLLVDQAFDIHVRLRYELDRFGILSIHVTVGRPVSAQGAPPFVLIGLSALLPLPERAVEALDFTGKWSRERSPQRQRIAFGTQLRESRRGRPSLDSPYVVAAGTESFRFRSGEVWAVHLGWSGNQRYVVERLPEGAGAHTAVIGAGELLLPGEIVLHAGEEYQAPTAYFAWSDAGLDGISDAFHAMLRARPAHPVSPRPLTLNTWEAVYFDHSLPKLLALVDAAAAVGVERIVLDDGWFQGRRDATSGLGDWFVDRAVWPDGLSPLVDRARAHGMEFGLWFEPEMVNLSSQVIQNHPDWLLAPARGAGAAVRHQHVLNIANPAAWDYLLGRIDALVSEYSISYIKWDHNRELHEAARRDANDRPGVHAQTMALYRLLDVLKTRHPALEIETCASGGGRIDLGILRRADRVWASDCNDPVERQAIQRWTLQLIPPELMGAHVGPAEAHTTSRTTPLSFRLITALFAHAGLEQDLTQLTADEIGVLAAWVELYKELRGLIHTGRTVRADLADDAYLLYGVVAPDFSRALLAWACLATSNAVQPGRVRIPGLDGARTYRIAVREEPGLPSFHEQPPEWLRRARQGSLLMPGRLLTSVGLPMPALDPQQAMLLDLSAS